MIVFKKVLIVIALHIDKKCQIEAIMTIAKIQINNLRDLKKEKTIHLKENNINLKCKVIKKMTKVKMMNHCQKYMIIILIIKMKLFIKVDKMLKMKIINKRNQI